MKHTWVTSLSVFGIIGAGSAAVLANTTVFNGVEKTNAAITISSTVPAASTSTATIASTEPTTTATTVAPGSVPQPYTVGDSGTVQLTNADGVITIKSALPAPGWTVQRASAPGSWVVVEFLSPTQRVVFNALMIDGQVQVTVDSAAPEPGTAAGAPPAATSKKSTSAAVATVAPTTTSNVTVTATRRVSPVTTPTTEKRSRDSTTTQPGSDD